MINLRRALSTLAAFAATLLPVAAQFDFAPGGGDDGRSKASLLAEPRSVAPGDTFTVALALEHPDEWHSYYLNSGGVELPLSIEWELPAGFTAAGIQWPVPLVKDGFFGKSFIYEGEPVFLVDLTAPADLAPGTTFSITARAAWQICKEMCIDENAELTLELAAADTTEADPRSAGFFTRARAALPASGEGWSFSATSDGGDVVLRAVPGAGAPADFEVADFVPDVPFLKSLGAGGSVERDGAAWVLTLDRNRTDFLDKPIPQGDAFSGILIGTGGGGVRVPETSLAGEARPLEALSFMRFLPVLGGMFLGGLILNLMPCVFPVIGIKIMGFVQQAGEDRRKIILHGLIFTVGVLASFAVLAGVLFAARQAVGGDAVGWGYQLQNPWVVLSLMLLMFLLAMNLYGVFEIGTSATSVGGSLQTKQGLGGSFFSGVLATVVATPCSAPFLGAAIGAAIALPALQFFAAFGFMALGLSLPYLVLSVFPKLIDFLPRPGAWMESFKQGMSFLLFATAGYLLWVYGGLIDLENLLDPLLGLSCIAIAAWVHGRWNLPHRKKSTRFIALAFTAVFAIGGFLLAKPPQPSAIDWQPWSAETQQELLDDGTPVYIDFTAKWCATCQVNKKRAYTTEVVELMRKKGVVALKADKTRPDPEIEKALRGYGRSAIPVNVLLAPDREPLVLPELLAPSDLLDAFGTL